MNNQKAIFGIFSMENYFLLVAKNNKGIFYCHISDNQEILYQDLRTQYPDVLFFSHIGSILWFVGGLIFIFCTPLLISVFNYYFFGEELSTTVYFYKKAFSVSTLLWVSLIFFRFFMPDAKTNLSEHHSLLFSPIGGDLWWVRCFLFLFVFPITTTIVYYYLKYKKI